VKRIALITSQAFSLINFRSGLIREMHRRGVIVYALAPDYDDNSLSAVASLGAIPVPYSMSRTGLNPLRDLLDVFRLVTLLRKFKLDLTFSFFIKPVIYGALAARLASVPKYFAMIEGAGYIFTTNNKPSIYRQLLRRFVILLYRVSLSKAEKVFLLNPDDRELFVKERMVHSTKTILLDGIGVDLDHYRYSKPPLQPVRFIMVARLLKEKGVLDYVKAARIVKAQYPLTRFLLVGSIDRNPGSITQAEVSAWVSEGLIECPGQVDDIRIWIAQSSVFVLPSYREGLPRSTQEAMAMGRPVITTDVPGCRETVLDGLNGFIVPPLNFQALAKAMLIFIVRPELIISMGTEGFYLAHERFNEKNINKNILSVLNI
jgi:glycosyltransferase involved in cell wall biosynthesis